MLDPTYICGRCDSSTITEDPAIMDIACFLEAFNARDAVADVSGISWSGDELVLELSVVQMDFEYPDPPRKLRVVCQDVAEIRVEFGGFEGAEWHADHPALWKHNHQNAYLYFSSAPSDPHAVIGRLWQANHDIYGGYRTMVDDFNLNGSALAGLLTGGHGQLAYGPRPVIARYVEAIGDAMETYILPGHVPPGGYHMLDFHGDCFVICRSATVDDTEAAQILALGTPLAPA
jgi:hypothetical protein